MSNSHRKRRSDLNLLLTPKEEIKDYIISCFQDDLNLTEEEARTTLSTFLEEKKDSNQIIINQFKAMELIKSLGDEPFKMKAYGEARRIIEKYPLPIVGVKQLEGIKGFGKSTTRFLSVILEEIKNNEKEE
jgi:hypothetical protein